MTGSEQLLVWAILSYVGIKLWMLSVRLEKLESENARIKDILSDLVEPL